MADTDKVISIFENILITDKPYLTSIAEITHRIKTGASKKQIEIIRATSDPAQKNIEKGRLPSICFSGQFKRRAIAGLVKHSGYVCVDFDHLGDRLESFKERLKSDKYVLIVFISPSGDGLKIIIKIPANKETHIGSCRAIADYYQDESLDNFEDVSRVCYESYDPDIYYNPDAEIFETIKEEKVIKKVIRTTGEIVVDHKEIIDRLITWLDSRGEFYVDNHKYNYIVKLAAACNRFGVPELTCIQEMIFRFSHQATPVSPEDFNRHISRVYSSYSHQSCSAHFEKEGTPINTITKKEIDGKELDVSLPMKDVIMLDSVRDSMIRTFHTGSAQGETTYFTCIDEVYRMKRRELTLFHGIMNHGKSTMVLQLFLIKSVRDGYKWGVFSPEQDPPDDFYDDLIHMYIGATTQFGMKGQMTLDEYKRGMDFVKEHFFYIYPESETPTPNNINDRFSALIKEKKIDGCLIDPYNQLDNDLKTAGGREDQYLSSFLTKQKRFAQENNVFMFIITHPRGNLRKDDVGNYVTPDVYDLAGGAMWSHKCDNVICVYRPYYSTDKTNTMTFFISQKIKKHKLCGIPGQATLSFDLSTMRYKDAIRGGGHPIDFMIKDEIVGEPEINVDLWHEKDNDKEAPF